MTDSTAPEAGGQYTHQLMQGITIAVVAYFLGMSLHPYADTIPDETLRYVMLSILMVMSYGMYLSVTSPIIVELLQRVEDELHQYLDAE